MNAPISQFTTGGVTQAWLLLSLMEDMIQERKKAIRERLMNEAAETGSQTATGSYKMNADGNTVVREKREKHKLKDEQVIALLEGKGIPILEGCDKVTSYVASQSKLQHLISIGKLQQSDLDALQEVTWALKVTASQDFAKLIEEAKASMAPPPDPALSKTNSL